MIAQKAIILHTFGAQVGSRVQGLGVKTEALQFAILASGLGLVPCGIQLTVQAKLKRAARTRLGEVGEN